MSPLYEDTDYRDIEMVCILKSRGWSLQEIEQLNVLELETALLWCQNQNSIENAQLLSAQHYHLLSQNKKTQMEAKKLFKNMTKTKELNPAKRPKVIDVIMQWANSKAFSK